MKDSKNNFIEISGKVEKSPIIINQNQDGNQSISNQCIEYNANEDSYYEISSKSANASGLVFLITVIVSTLALNIKYSDSKSNS